MYSRTGLAHSAVVTAASLGVGLVLMYVVKATGTLRISKEGEMEGIDLHEHGGSAYPELITSGHAMAELAPEKKPAGALAMTPAQT